jgi:hypothetical protein
MPNPFEELAGLDRLINPAVIRKTNLLLAFLFSVS